MSDRRLPSEFHSLSYHDKTLQILTKAFDTATLSHALLFTGMRGIGKLAAARFFAMACNCTAAVKPESAVSHDRACGRCRSCRKILNETHPDIILLGHADPQIKIDQVRNLVQRLSLKPNEAIQRFAIIAHADSMTPEAGNALLKILEEPPDRTTFILTAVQVSDLLSTIVSRCLHLRMKALPAAYISGFLEKIHGAEPGEAAALARMAQGSLTRGEYMKSNGWLEIRGHLVDEWMHLHDRSRGYVLALAERLSRNREFLLEALEMLKLWIRDLIVYQHAPDQIICTDIEAQVQEASRHSESGKLLIQIDRIHDLQKKIESNGNARLLTETLLMNMAGQ